ncbi:hypothetical protein GCM10009797_30510 [Nocardioides hwasunensis]
MSAGFGVVTGVLACALGVGLVLEAESAFGRVWASAFIVFGVVAAFSAVVAARPLEDRSPAARAAGATVLLLLAAWAAVAAVIGAIEESWLWGVLLGVPALYLLWAVTRLARGPGRTTTS